MIVYIFASIIKKIKKKFIKQKEINRKKITCRHWLMAEKIKSIYILNTDFILSSILHACVNIILSSFIYSSISFNTGLLAVY